MQEKGKNSEASDQAASTGNLEVGDCVITPSRRVGEVLIEDKLVLSRHA